jgi:hypothetical protein
LILPNVPLGRHEVLAAVTCGDLKKEYRMTIVVQVAAAVGAGAVVQRCLLAPLAPAPARPGLCPARCRTAHGVRRGNAPGQGPIAMQCHERLRARGCLRWYGLLCSAQCVRLCYALQPPEARPFEDPDEDRHFAHLSPGPRNA